jgi:DNA-binding SARP family transcriptional activator/tetratricopeptide (TPR) repeat protein
MEARRYLRCMGQPALFSPAGEPIRFRTKKHLALLVYLAVESRHAHRRDRLAEVLWPKVSTAEARHSLATALSILRPRLGSEILETSRDQVVLAPGRIALDLDRLVAGDVLGTEVTGKLEVAAFLEGFDIPDAVEFAMWKDRQQARLLPAIKDALVVLIDRCRRTGDSRQIEQLADRMLALDELSEEAIRAKMEARAFAGDRLTALRIFEAWREKLAEDVGAVPSELVEGIAVRLRRRGWERTTRIDIPTVPTDQWRGRPFIGRSKEYQVLYEAWEAMRQGVPAHVLVLGDSGIGKTTLVERLTTAAGLEGAVISRVQCYDLEREIPYSTLGTLIHGLLDRPGVSATPPEALAEIARTVQEVRRRFPSIPHAAESQGETSRIRLTESFMQMLQAIAEEHPVVLVLDDLHLADDASLAVLHLVMRRSVGQPVMVMLIARPGELPQSPQAARLRETGRALGIREIELAPLNDQESRDFLNSLIPSDDVHPNTSARRLLLRAAAGFPMVLELLAQDWQANGDQSLALAVDAMTAELGTGCAPPGVYREVLERISRSLDPTTQSVLNLAAILGHRLNDVSMYPLADLGVGQTMTGMADLAGRRVLRDAGQGMEFVNELVRTAAYLGVPSPLRHLLHGKIADRLIQAKEPNGEVLGLEIAWHCMRAGRIAEATPHLLRGARHAIRIGAPHGAERAVASALPKLIASARVEATLLLVEVLQEQGRWMESLDCLAIVDADTAAMIKSETFVLAALAKLNLGASASQEVVQRVPELSEIIRNSPDPATKARAGRAIAYALAAKRDKKLTGEALRLVETIPERGLDPDAAGQLALAKALLLYESGDTAASFTLVKAAIDELGRGGAANLIMVQLHTGLGSIQAREGRYEEAVTAFEQAFRMAQRLGNDSQVATIAGNLALCCVRLGRYADQIQWASRAMTSAAPELSGYTEIQLAYSTALAHALSGRADQAMRVASDLEPRLVGTWPAWMHQAWTLWKADVLHLSGHHMDAVLIAHGGLDGDHFQLKSSSFAGPFARWVALTSHVRNGQARAKQLVADLVSNLETYDSLDQVEILCAGLCLGLTLEKGGGTPSVIESKLEQLPPAVRRQLDYLGVLPNLI